MCVCVCIHVCMYACMYVCMYVYVCVCDFNTFTENLDTRLFWNYKSMFEKVKY